jgi:hypothetical protein
MFQVRLRRSPDGSRLAATRSEPPWCRRPSVQWQVLMGRCSPRPHPCRHRNRQRPTPKSPPPIIESWAHELHRAWQMRIGAGQYGSRVHHPRQRQPKTAQISPVWRHPQPGDSRNGLGGGNGGLFRDAGCLAVPRANSFGTGDIFGNRLMQPIHILRHGVRLSKRHCDASFVEGIEDGDP